ncbi:MAG TPA: SPFH domain-containing protein [Candidatus Saccharimonadales bacterium]|nr:SPFH domain-containing protein [Candidatus Saccharimonadales bacterium]
MSQFLEVLEWTDPLPGEIVRRYPAEGSAEIKMGAVCVVQEAQQAVFFRDGKVLDALGPGRHVLSTLNLPVLTKLLSLPYGFKSPFRTAMYFVSTRVFTDLRWGTKNPVAFRDKDLGLVRLRGFGVYTLRVGDPVLFVNTLMGARGTLNSAEVSDYLCDVIVARLNDLLGETFTSILDLPAGYEALAAKVKNAVHEDFAKYGIELVDVFVNSVTPPDEVQKMLDERSGLGAVGNLDNFLKYEAAKALGGSAQGGGMAATAAQAGMGVGVGAGVGAALPAMLAQSMQARPEGAAVSLAAVCGACAGAVPAGSKYCPQCGTALAAAAACPKCGTARVPGAKFCPGCGEKLA